jgi:CelD/BcsL family acetyltransferase involved in cellulose biosynthesis
MLRRQPLPEPGAILALVTLTLDTEPACPGSEVERQSSAVRSRPPRRLLAQRRPFDSIDRSTWDRLAAATPWATPFARWGFHRAWWDGYGASAHEQTLVVVDGDADPATPPIAIVPLMHRHGVEPTDDATRSTIRHGPRLELTPVEPDCKIVFFGASYHADYGTILGAPEDVAAVADATAFQLSQESSRDDHPMPWDVIDLRRLRCGDPAAEALREAFARCGETAGWTSVLEREDVCPVVTLPEGADFDAYLATLRKKDRHEIRRKLRRANSAGDVRLVESTDPLADLDAFIDLHQKRWGADGLFPPTPGGEASRVFARRLFELLDDGTVRLVFLTVGERRIAAGIHFEVPDGLLFYNAGTDPEARSLSPGVVMIAKYVEYAMERGLRRLDFLRGAEPYKYEWGAVDEPIQRLLVRRSGER